MIKQRNNLSLILAILVGLVLPPIISMAISLFLLFKLNDKRFIYSILIYIVLYLTYKFFSIDNIGRFQATINYESTQLFFEDTLTSLMYWGIVYMKLECSHFFYLYILLIYVFFYKTLDKCVNKWYPAIIFILIMGISLRYTIDLLYYTLSLSFCLFYITNKKASKVFDYVILIIVVYLLHPGVLLILLPAIFIYNIMHVALKQKTWIYYLSVISVFVLYYLLAHNPITISTGIPFIDAVLSMFSNYTGDQYWAKRSGTTEISGITYTITYYIIPFIYYLLFFYTVINWKKFSNKYILSIFQVSMLLYPNFINYVTLTERTLLVISVSGILTCASMIHDCRINNKLYFNILAGACSLIFLFNITKCSGAIMLKNVFKEGSYEQIQLSSLYTPSIVLFNYNTSGFSDDFLIHNTDIRF